MNGDTGDDDGHGEEDEHTGEEDLAAAAAAAAANTDEELRPSRQDGNGLPPFCRPGDTAMAMDRNHCTKSISLGVRCCFSAARERNKT